MYYSFVHSSYRVQLISVNYSLYLNVGDRTNGIQTRNEESWLIYFKPYTEEMPSY